MEGHILVGLSSVQLADNLIEEGLNIEDVTLRTGHVHHPEDDATRGSLLGLLAKIKVKCYLEDCCWADALKLSQIPARLDVKAKGVVTHVYVTYGIKCSLCYKQGHKRANCPRKTGLQEDNLVLPRDAPDACFKAWTKPPSTSNTPPVAGGVFEVEGGNSSITIADLVADPPLSHTVRAEEAVVLTLPTPENQSESLPESSQEKRFLAENQMDDILKNKKTSEAIARAQKLGLERGELLQALTHYGIMDRLIRKSNNDQRKAIANLATKLMSLTVETSSTLYKKLSCARTSARRSK
ncbi:hypothetical protein LAZ67_20001362 [Cordylochernes scorpioides]|uniref:Uncharacterized protein n=1 Tax=Cordylochernes scorpioides TaxID=51811 RepID=A0ABY6LME8_9ARAC|nr:hypothetical protein LAZ67_20001362 [Cordylochernes scorpioides]